MTLFYIKFFYRLAGWAFLFDYQVQKETKNPLVAIRGVLRICFWTHLDNDLAVVRSNCSTYISRCFNNGDTKNGKYIFYYYIFSFKNMFFIFDWRIYNWPNNNYSFYFLIIWWSIIYLQERILYSVFLPGVNFSKSTDLISLFHNNYIRYFLLALKDSLLVSHSYSAF